MKLSKPLTLKTAKGRRVWLTALLCLLSGCARELTEGEIVNKHYEPAYDFVMFIPIAMSCGKNCTTTMMIPYWVHDDEDWVLKVRGFNSDGKEITENWYVTKEVYEHAKVGRIEKYNESTAKKIDEHEKIRKEDA